MKSYEKPQLMFLSVSGNDQLCGSCSEEQDSLNVSGELLYKDPTGYIASDIDRLVGNKDGTLTRDEALNLFGNGEKDCKTEVDIYCKFTSTGNLVAWS